MLFFVFRMIMILNSVVSLVFGLLRIVSAARYTYFVFIVGSRTLLVTKQKNPVHSKTTTTKPKLTTKQKKSKTTEPKKPSVLSPVKLKPVPLKRTPLSSPSPKKKSVPTLPLVAEDDHQFVPTYEDHDCDGIPDDIDDDIDNDGLLDRTQDSDHDGLLNHIDDDDDNDGKATNLNVL